MSQRDRRILTHGFNTMQNPLPIYLEDLQNDVDTCPCLIEGDCPGRTDAGFYGRCVQGNLGYLDCRIFKEWSTAFNDSSKEHAKSQALYDTVVMHADEIPRRESEYSLEDQVNHGASFSRFEILRRSLSKDQRWRMS
ncbi:MAG: hypothetical protein RL557_872 [archaeon]